MVKSNLRKTIELSVLVLLVSIGLQPRLLAQVNISSGGFTPSTVCSSGSLVAGCQVATNNDAIPNSGALQLTQSLGNQTGSAWAVNPQAVVYGFSTTFTFQLTNPSTPAPGDGFAFVIQNAPSGL